MIVACNWGC